MIDIDNKKMWESIRKALWNWPMHHWLCECIDKALRDQGLEYKDGKIVSIDPEQSPYDTCAHYFGGCAMTCSKYKEYQESLNHS